MVHNLTAKAVRHAKVQCITYMLGSALIATMALTTIIVVFSISSSSKELLVPFYMFAVFAGAMIGFYFWARSRLDLIKRLNEYDRETHRNTEGSASK